MSEHDHDPYRLRCTRCGQASDELGSYPGPCNPPQEAA